MSIFKGTGRSLSLKLLEQLRQQSNRLAVTANEGGAAGRTLHECELKVNTIVFKSYIKLLFFVYDFLTILPFLAFVFC